MARTRTRGPSAILISNRVLLLDLAVIVLGSLTLASMVLAPLIVYGEATMPALTRRRVRFGMYVLAASPGVIALLCGIALIAARFLGWSHFGQWYVGGSLLATLATIDHMARPALRAAASFVEQPTTRLGARSVRVVRSATTVVYLAVAVAVGSELVEPEMPCIETELLLPAAATPRPEPVPMHEVLLEPEPGAMMVADEGLDLQRAAESRHDPASLDHLTRAGFVEGRQRLWEAADGRLIHADVFEFGDAEGALEFQRAVNRYACQAAIDAFGAARRGIGLQVLRSSGDPVEEQISWVSGPRRYLVSVRHLQPPEDHRRVMRMAERLMTRSDR